MHGESGNLHFYHIAFPLKIKLDITRNPIHLYNFLGYIDLDFHTRCTCLVGMGSLMLL